MSVFHTLAGRGVAGLPRQVAIVGARGMVQAGRVQQENPPNTTDMIRQVLHQALRDAKLTINDIDGLIAVPSLVDNHFMEAHYQATCLGMFSDSIEDDRPLRCRTIDTGGAGPVSALLEGVRMIQHEALECVAVVAADAVGSMSSDVFLSKADRIWKQYFRQQQQQQGDRKQNSTTLSPAIPHGYDRVTEYQMQTFGVTRDQLRMAVCLLSAHAGRHPESLFHQKRRQPRAQPKEISTASVSELLHQLPHLEKNCNDLAALPPFYTTLQHVRDSPAVTPHISLLECARRADGAACLILASTRFLKRRGLPTSGLPCVIGSGESSGPLYPPLPMNETPFSADEAMTYAYASAGNLTAADIDWFGLYDCFPVCLVRALEAAGLCDKGEGGQYLEHHYDRLVTAIHDNDQLDRLFADPTFFPVNTHGGLLSFGAPWEVPAMYNIIEAVHQMTGTARGRQVPNCRRALVYGNGGIFSASSVAILALSK